MIRISRSALLRRSLVFPIRNYWFGYNFMLLLEVVHNRYIFPGCFFCDAGPFCRSDIRPLS